MATMWLGFKLWAGVMVASVLVPVLLIVLLIVLCGGLVLGCGLWRDHCRVKRRRKVRKK